jgi:hypothetical protein
VAKGKNEVCGGPWGTSGSCATGLNCLKICKYDCNWEDWAFQEEGRCVNAAEVLLNPPSEKFTIEKNFKDSNKPIQKCPGGFTGWNTPWNTDYGSLERK